MEYYTNKQDKLDFRQLVLQQIQKVQNVLSKELKLYQSFIPPTNNTASFEIEKEDTRYSFIQSVEALSYLLYPYFDEQMQNVYKPFEKAVDSYWFEFYDDNKEFCNKILNNLREGEQGNKEDFEMGEIQSVFLKYKIRKAKEVFRELSLLLKRNDYLAGSVYQEAGEDEINDVDEQTTD